MSDQPESVDPKTTADEAPKPDPVEALRRNTEHGVQSVIHYDKKDGSAPTRRVIEPHSIAHGLSGLLVRAMQLEPERGKRHYKSDHIVQVEPNDIPLAEPRPVCDPPVPEIPLEPTGVPAPAQTGGGQVTIECSSGGALPLEGVTVVPSVPWLLRSPLERHGFNEYLDAVRDAVLDLVIEESERERLAIIRSEHGMSDGQTRAAHARVFAEYVMGYSNDGDIDSDEIEHLQQLRRCLDEIGWCPG